MKRKDRIREEEKDRFYPIFNEFQVIDKKKNLNRELHFIVPWEIMEKTTKKFVY